MHGLLNVVTNKTYVKLTLGQHVNTLFNNKCNYLIRKVNKFQNEDMFFTYEWNDLNKSEIKTIELFLDWYCENKKKKNERYSEIYFKRTARPSDIKYGTYKYYEDNRIFFN